MSFYLRTGRASFGPTRPLLSSMAPCYGWRRTPKPAHCLLGQVGVGVERLQSRRHCDFTTRSDASFFFTYINNAVAMGVPFVSASGLFVFPLPRDIICWGGVDVKRQTHTESDIHPTSTQCSKRTRLLEIGNLFENNLFFVFIERIRHL